MILYTLRVLDDLGCDLVLGCDWFNICSPVEFDFLRITITVQLSDQKLKLQDTKSTTTGSYNFISGPSLYHLLLSEYEIDVDKIFVLHMQPIQKPGSADLAELLEQYTDVFEEPTELPPGRGVEH